MKQIKVKGGFNRFKIVDAGGFTVGIIEITQIGLEAEIGIVEKGEIYQRFEMMHSLKGASKKRLRKDVSPYSKRDQISGALGKIKGALGRIKRGLIWSWSTSKKIYDYLITGNNLMMILLLAISMYVIIITVLEMF